MAFPNPSPSAAALSPADVVRGLFGRDTPVPGTLPARTEPMRSSIATPAPAERMAHITAQVAAMMLAMQALVDEVKQLTAQLQPQAESTAALHLVATAALPPAADPLQQPDGDAWRKYARTHGARGANAGRPDALGQGQARVR